jgi:DNA-binding MarR family transcriptional regulator
MKSIINHFDCQDKTLLSNFNLTSIRLEIIKHINRHPGINYIDLSRLAMCTKGNTTRVVASMIRDGIITRQDNPEDRRSYCLFLTDEGKDLLKEVNEAYLHHIQSLMVKFSDDQLENFASISSQFASALKAQDQSFMV